MEGRDPEKVKAFLDGIAKRYMIPESQNQRMTMGNPSTELQSGQVKYLRARESKNPKIFSSSIH